MTNRELQRRYLSGAKQYKSVQANIKRQLKRTCAKWGCQESLAFELDKRVLCDTHRKLVMAMKVDPDTTATARKAAKRPKRGRYGHKCKTEGCTARLKHNAKKRCDVHAKEDRLRKTREYQKLHPASEGKITTRKCSQCKEKRRIPAARKLCFGCRGFNNAVSMGRILPPDYSEVNVNGYKEPMQKVEDGFGYLGAITTTDDGAFIQCHICGYYYGNVGAHVTFKHKQSVREYKEEYGLKIGEGLISPKARETMQRAYNLNARDRSHFVKMSTKAHEAIKERGVKLGGHGWNAQTRNEKGMCREQTLAKIKYIASLNDGVPLLKHFLQTYGWGQQSTINFWFGNWQVAVREAGFANNLERHVTNRQVHIDETVERMQAFYKEHGRTPQSSDISSEYGFLPVDRVSRLFHGLNNARRVAGIPVLVSLGNGKWGEVMETKKEESNV